MKCLFQVRTIERQRFLNEWQESGETDCDSYIYKKMENEKRENEEEFRIKKGQPVIYGQKIVLKHIYSGTYLNLDPMKLAKENGCIEVQLSSTIISPFYLGLT